MPVTVAPGYRSLQYRVKVLGEFLYWRALEEGGQCDCNCDNVWKNHHWSAGWRVGASVQSLCSDCQGALIWTHYQQSPHHGCRGGCDAEIEGCGDHWKLRYDTIDLLFISALHYNSCLCLKPYWGVRGVDIRQKVFTLCAEESHCLVDNFSLIKEKRDRDTFKAVGPLGGFLADYKFGSCLSFFGNASLGLLYGNHCLRSNCASTFTNPEQRCTCSEISRDQASQLFLDLAIGVRWEQTICRNVQLIHQIGVEHHRYFGFNHFGFLGDLYFDGVNISLGLGF